MGAAAEEHGDGEDPRAEGEEQAVPAEEHARRDHGDDAHTRRNAKDNLKDLHTSSPEGRYKIPSIVA